VRVLLILLFCCAATSVSANNDKNFKRSTTLMGCNFEITVVASSQENADNYIDAAVSEISRIEKLISSWDPNSETSSINKNAGVQAVAVSGELFALIQRSLYLSRLTDGAFDISYASMDRLWKFDGSMTQMPDPAAIKASVETVGFENIVLSEETHTVFLKLPGMKIGFGGIGKGYAADMAKQLLIDLGVSGGIINASGDMNTWGQQYNDTPWQVAITHPIQKERPFATMPIKGAVVTSGNYEKFVTFNDIRYAHIINPKTGYPATGIISVTIFAPKAELADALATSVFLMGPEVGLDRINQLPKTECIIITDTGKVLSSTNITLAQQQLQLND